MIWILAGVGIIAIPVVIGWFLDQYSPFESELFESDDDQPLE